MSLPQARRASALATETGSAFRAVRRQRASGIPDQWAEVVVNEGLRKLGAPIGGSGLLGTENSLASHFREAPRLHWNAGIPQDKTKPSILQESRLQKSAWEACAVQVRGKRAVAPRRASSRDAAGPANGGVSSPPAGPAPRQRTKVICGHLRVGGTAVV